MGDLMAAFARRYVKGAQPHRDPVEDVAVDAAARALGEIVPRLAPEIARRAAYAMLTAYILKQAERAFTEPDIMRALASEKPWRMVELINPAKTDEARLLALLPVVAEVAMAIDPDGTKPFFSYSKPEVLRLLDAAVQAWEVSHEANRGQLPDDEIPFDVAPGVPA